MNETPLTRFEVFKMIDEAIDRYDSKQERRHQENRVRLDDMNKSLNRIIGVLLFLAALIPLITHFLSKI